MIAFFYQLDEQILYFNILYASTCFEHYYALLQEVNYISTASGVPMNFVRGGGGSQNSIEDRGQRERGSGRGSPLVRGSGGSCNLIKEISFHIVKFS